MSQRPATLAEQQAAAQDRAARVRKALGLATKAPDKWSYEERFAYNKALASAILAEKNDTGPNRPSPVDIAKAERASSAAFQDVGSYGIFDAAGDFAGEFVNQAESINPLSEQNRGKLATTLSMIAALAAVAFFAVWAFRTSPARNA